MKHEEHSKQHHDTVKTNHKLPLALGVTFMLLCILGVLAFWGGVLFGERPSDAISVSPTASEIVPPLPVAVSLSDSAVEVGKGLSHQFRASGGEHITWVTSDKNIATIDENGLLKAVSVGHCIVTAQNEDGSTADCQVDVKKTCYLTFDDGPNQNTEDILKVLKDNDVRATFFVVNSKYLSVTKQMQEQGCLVGMHTYNHDYEVCYRTYYSYYYGLDNLSKKIEQYTGTKPNIIRFPGGTGNGQSDGLLMCRVANGAKDLGYRVFDWTATAGDTSPTKASADFSVSRVLETCTGDEEIVLMHDKKFNAKALETIIPGLRKAGYVFETLDHYPQECFMRQTQYKKNVPAQALSLNRTSYKLKPEGTVKLVGKMKPSSSTDYIRWESADPSIAYVTADGLVTAVKSGTVEITGITSSDQRAVCNITVK